MSKKDASLQSVIGGLEENTGILGVGLEHEELL